jgi:hypothetical protein
MDSNQEGPKVGQQAAKFQLGRVSIRVNDVLPHKSGEPEDLFTNTTFLRYLCVPRFASIASRHRAFIHRSCAQTTSTEQQRTFYRHTLRCGHDNIPTDES